MIGSAEVPADISKARFPVLVSYHYMRKWPEHDIEDFLSDKRIEIMLDSGAFSAKNSGAEIPFDEYMEFLHKHGRRFRGGYVALDKLGDPEQSRINLDIMYREGLSPMPVHVWGDDRRRMDELFERSDKVCLGGFKRPGRGAAPKKYVLQKMRWARGRNVHWLGYTNQEMITALRPHSCDSSSWSYATRYGWMFAYIGNGTMGKFKADKRDNPPVSRSKMKALARDAGVDWESLKDLSAWSGGDSAVHRIGVLSWVRYVMDLRAQYGVRYNLAFTNQKHGNHIRSMIHQEVSRRHV